jgi:hypothetical protein
MTPLFAAVVFVTATQDSPSQPRAREAMECVEFASPPQWRPGIVFRATLPRGLELRVDGDIKVGPVSEPRRDYLWLVSPPLQTAPQRIIGGGYNLTAEQSVKIPRSLHFVVTEADYQRMFRVVATGPPANLYEAELKRLTLGTLSLTVTDYKLGGNDYEWLSFKGEACVPR